MTYPDRIAARAADVKPLRVLLSLLAAPFYAAGFLVGLVAVVVVWCYAAAGVGFSDARTRRASGGDD